MVLRMKLLIPCRYLLALRMILQLNMKKDTGISMQKTTYFTVYLMIKSISKAHTTANLRKCKMPLSSMIFKNVKTTL